LRAKYFLQLIGLSALWGASFMLLRIASPVMGPQVLTALRLGLATVTLAIIMRAMRHRWPWEHWRELGLLGVLSVATPFILFSWAALHLPAGYSALLNSTAALFGTFCAAWLKEDTLTARKLMGCLCGFAGVALIVRLGPVQPTPTVILAALACIGAAAAFGISAPLMKRATSRMQPLQIAAGIHAASFLILLPGAAWTWPQAHFTAGALAIVALLGIITSGLAYWAHLRIVRHVTPVAAMSPMFMIPVFGVAWGHVFLGEPLSPGIYAGGASVLLASALVSGFNPWRKSIEALGPKA
jgi:drug/metabolite transporter (DMT)-like permease